MAAPGTEESNKQQVNLTPIGSYKTEEGQGEFFILNHPEVIKAKTSNTVEIIKVSAGVALVSFITLACFYVVVFKSTLNFHDDAARIILIIVGAVTASVFAATSAKKDDG